VTESYGPSFVSIHMITKSGGMRRAWSRGVRRCLLVVLAACGAPLPRSPTPALALDTDTSSARELRASLERLHIVLEWRDGDTTALKTPACGDLSAVGSCVTCELVGEHDLDPLAFTTIAEAFARYPAEVIAASRIERVSLCRNITSASLEPKQYGGLAENATHRMLVGADPHTPVSYFERVVHHELYHLVESARQPDLHADDPEWAHANPDGFTYPGTRSQPVPGFADGYALTNAVEDRASTYELAMTDADDMCARSTKEAGLRRKLEIVWDRMAGIAGDGYLRARAPCLPSAIGNN